PTRPRIEPFFLNVRLMSFNTGTPEKLLLSCFSAKTGTSMDTFSRSRVQRQSTRSRRVDIRLPVVCRPQDAEQRHERDHHALQRVDDVPLDTEQVEAVVEHDDQRRTGGCTENAASS